MTSLKLSADEELITNSENSYDVLEPASTLFARNEFLHSNAVPPPPRCSRG